MRLEKMTEDGQTCLASGHKSNYYCHYENMPLLCVRNEP